MKDLILLHGALGCNSHWNHILPYLDKDFRIHNLNFPLHGGEPSPFESLTQVELSNYIVSYVEQNSIMTFSIAGYSMGGYMALDLAIQHYPDLEKVLTLGTKLNWSPEIAEEEVSKLSPEKLEPIHAKLEQEHGAKWKHVIHATHHIMRNIGSYPLTAGDMDSIEIPVLLLVGEKDKMVSIAETAAFCDGNTMLSYDVLEAQPHLLERVDGALVAQKINEFLTSGNGAG